MIHIKKLDFVFVKIAMLLLGLLILSACSIRQEKSQPEIEEPSKVIIDNVNESTEMVLDFISIEKIETYEGMEITDWIDEQTVVLAKENKELEKMTLFENDEFYPRSIYVYNLGTKELKTVKAQKGAFLGGATLSTDKKHLLYYEYAMGDVAYYLMSLEDEEQTSEAGDSIGIAYTAEWTDEQNVIGVSYSGGAYMADVVGNLTQIDELKEEQLFTVHKTKGEIYYITTDSPSYQVYRLDPVTKEKKNLQLENVDGITISPDGKQILVTQVTGSMKRLIIADADGTIQGTIAEGSEVTGVSWSPNQQMIAFQLISDINDGDSNGLYLYDVSTGKSMQINKNIGYGAIRWSPSGKKIAVSELNERNYNSSIIYIK